MFKNSKAESRRHETRQVFKTCRVYYLYNSADYKLSAAKQYSFWNLEFKKWNFNKYKELFPAIRFNLFGANPAPKRISAPIGARAPVFRIGYREKLCAFAPLREQKGQKGGFRILNSFQRAGIKSENSAKPRI